jgi:hypothetical protein
MPFASDRDEQIHRLEAELGGAEAVTPALMADALTLASAGRRAPGGVDKANRVRALIDAQAWTDAALALLELELPQWKLRCIAYEDGEWHCSLGKHWPLPAWLDDVVDASHPMLSLALLAAFVKACAVTSDSSEAARTAPAVRSSPYGAICCDDFF